MKKFLIDSYKSISGHLEFAMRGYSYAPDELIVLCMHSTPEHLIERFKLILDDLLKHFRPLDPADLGAYFRGELDKGPYLFFTFDDGLKNNLRVAEALESRGLRAAFFIVPDFVKAKDGEAYYRTNIRKEIAADYAKEKEDLTPMSEDDLQKLTQRGHLIGSHTMSHLLRRTSSDEHAENEVANSKRILMEMLHQPVDAFCSPIHTALSVDARIRRMIAMNYRFHFTTFPGCHSELKDPQMIYRRNIEVDWSTGKIRFALGQWDLRRWKSGIAQWRADDSRP